MIKREKKIVAFIITVTAILFLFLSQWCFAGWDNTLPADSSVWNDAAGMIRDNWDALEVAFGVDLASASPFIDVTNTTYGADANGTTDDTTAIQAAIDVVEALGGGVVWLPAGTYKTTATLTLYDGVRLLGAGNSYNGTGGSTGKGTVLKVTGNAPGITINGATGYGFEIANMHILGDGDASQDGIYLVKSNSSVPRSSYIHDISIESVGRDGIRFDGFSYITCERVHVVSAGAHGFYTLDVTTNPVQEYLYFRDCSANSCTGNGFNFTSGGLINLYACDSAKNAKGLVISGDTYQIYTTHLSLSQNTSQGIEISADTGNIGRFSFRDTFIYMVGTSASEKAIYTHRTSTYTVGNIHFDNVDITKDGATSPTTAIDIDTSFDDSSLTKIRNASGGAVSVPTDKNFIYEDVIKSGIEALADDATPTVQGAKKVKTGGTTTITDFDDGYTGQVIILVSEHAITITDGTNIFLNGSTNWTMAATDTLTLICKSDNLWYEIGRSYGASPSGEILLSRTLLVSFNTTDKTDLYTVPTGRKAIITKVIIHTLSTNTAIDSGSNIAFGDGASANTWHTGDVLTTVDGTDDYFIITQDDTRIEATFDAADVFGVKPVAAAGSAVTATIDVFGYLL